MSSSTDHGPSNLPGELVVAETAEETADRLALDLTRHLQQRLLVASAVNVALSGGSSGRLLCAALVKHGNVAVLDWPRVHVWLVDERCVAPGDPRLNFGLLAGTLSGHGPVPAANLHPMPALEDEGDRWYERDLLQALAAADAEQRLDAVILGMGQDGHTASLFPGSPALDENTRSVVKNDGETVADPRPRLTMTYPLLNRARFIAFLVTGAGKQTALERVALRREGLHTLPAAGLVGSPGVPIRWYVDRPAYGGR